MTCSHCGGKLMLVGDFLPNATLEYEQRCFACGRSPLGTLPAPKIPVRYSDKRRMAAFEREARKRKE